MLTWVNPHSNLWESGGAEMEAHKDCTASACGGRNFILDFLTLSKMGPSHTHHRLQEAESQKALSVQVRGDKDVTGVEREKQGENELEERLKNMQ